MTNYLVKINKELVFLSRFWGNLVSMQREEVLILRLSFCFRLMKTIYGIPFTT